MIVVDTSAMIALLDSSDNYHAPVKGLFERNSHRWILPAAIIPEVDYIASAHLGKRAQDSFFRDLADGTFSVEWGRNEDVTLAHRISERYAALRLGFVDAMVAATAERLKAEAIATLDLRHFSVLSIKGQPRLLPRDF